MYKAGTVAELEALELEREIPDEVYREALKIVTMLDENFGDNRDVDNEDGGFVVIAEDKDDLAYFAQNCIELEAPCLEYVDFVHSEKEIYLNAFFLVNEYEFGMTLFVPISIAPEILLKEAQSSMGHR